MPFDGVESPFGSLAKLDQAIELIETPNHWVKHSYSTPWGGYCLREALNMVGVAELFEPVILKTATRVMGREFCCIESFNDHPLTRHADVVAVLGSVRADLVSGRVDLPRQVGLRPAAASDKPAGHFVFAFWRRMFG